MAKHDSKSPIHNTRIRRWFGVQSFKGTVFGRWLGFGLAILGVYILSSANISFKLLQKLGGGSVLGPIMIGGEKPFQIVQMGASVTEIVNSAAIATYNSISTNTS